MKYGHICKDENNKKIKDASVKAMAFQKIEAHKLLCDNNPAVKISSASFYI